MSDWIDVKRVSYKGRHIDILTSELVSESAFQVFHNPLTQTDEQFLRKVGRLGSGMIREIMSVTGVHSVTVQPNKIHVVLLPVHDWDIIQEKILDIIANVIFEKKVEDIEITKTDSFK